jgi:hypothetical protein
MAVARAGYPVWLWLAGPTFSSLFITGTYTIAINMPFVTKLIMKGLANKSLQLFWYPGDFWQKSSQKM